MAGGTGRKAKTAVVLIHGMGEPTPLENIRSFVDSVYARDRRLASNSNHDGPLTVSIVPDAATGSAELRRITTHDDGPSKRTDFYEFYWADIMDDTPLELVTSWIQRLLLRAPWRVPRTVRVFSAWLLLWLLALIAGFFVIAAAYPALMDWAAPLGAWLDQNRLLAGLTFAAIGAGLLVANVVGVLRSKRPTIMNVRLRWPLLLFVAAAILVLLPPIEPRWAAAAAAAGVAWLMNTFAGPYFGDVARYVRATPRTVEKRRQVRERGLALLEALHAKREDGPDLANFTHAEANNPPYYDRIVIVGHSLGSIIAYDLLQLFWERYGPTHHIDWPAGAERVQRALRKSDLYVRVLAKSGHTRTFRERERRAFTMRQQQLREALAAERPRWRITDLVTLGSPLAHAEFLLTDSRAEVELGFVERRFASCPPRPDPISKPSMLFSQDGVFYPHFAAQFAAVRWTNICDVHPVPFVGDLVSGRLRQMFGPGIVEFNVPMRNPRWFWFFKRVFTHLQYWDWHESYDDPPGTPAAQHGVNVPAHILCLREVLRLGS